MSAKSDIKGAGKRKDEKKGIRRKKDSEHAGDVCMFLAKAFVFEKKTDAETMY